MIVVAVETLRDPVHREFLWVRVETDTGVQGLGETMPKPLAVEQAVHERFASLLLGRELSPELFWSEAFSSIGYTGYAGAETRALSAIDIALWDALARSVDLPIATLLGGKVRDRVRVYNTCVGFGSWPDREGFLERPADLARELSDEGYSAMKVWPFDAYSVGSGGHWIAPQDLATGVSTVSDIKNVLGDGMDVAVEGHSGWDLPTSIKLAHALEPFSPMWVEDLMQARSPNAWRQLREATSVPVTGSERVFTRFGIHPFLEAGALDIVNQDVAWTGGISEMRKVAAMAEVFELPVTPHNCHGPVAAAASVAIGLSVPNVSLVETVRSFERGIHPDIAVGGHTVEGGFATMSDAPGLGVELLPGFLERCIRRRTELSPSTTVAAGWTTGDPWAGGVDEGM
ncbi:MAG: mandelate racemase/muconate lactonizing enzyme family protein [Microcella sp.]|uniref:mandelate racemase/muconate lactonizing enzyme family protein n=1 Tax=Microcella sp. TaxID=1913979 RepID=UPI0033151017